MLAARGAKLFLIARNEEALRSVRDEIRAGGGEAAYAVADVADKVALDAAAAAAVETFGGYDTWINDGRRLHLRPARRGLAGGPAPAV